MKTTLEAGDFRKVRLTSFLPPLPSPPPPHLPPLLAFPPPSTCATSVWQPHVEWLMRMWGSKGSESSPEENLFLLFKFSLLSKKKIVRVCFIGFFFLEERTTQRFQKRENTVVNQHTVLLKKSRYGKAQLVAYISFDRTRRIPITRDRIVDRHYHKFHMIFSNTTVSGMRKRSPKKRTSSTTSNNKHKTIGSTHADWQAKPQPIYIFRYGPEGIRRS